MTDAVLFDMDGVVLVGPGTHPDVYRRAAADALADCGVADPPADALATLGAARYDDAMAAACADLGVDVDAFWAARERHASRRTNERVRRGDRAVYDDVDAVADIAGSTRAGLVSNNRQATVEFVADHLGLADDLEVVSGRAPTLSDYGRRKPEPDFIADALGALDVDSALYVGDRRSDVVAARRAGVEAAFVRRPHNEGVAPDPEPAHTLDSLWDLRDLVGR